MERKFSILRNKSQKRSQVFMGSAVFVGFLQNPDGLGFFVFSNIA
jgi:hypothetical protein